MVGSFIVVLPTLSLRAPERCVAISAHNSPTGIARLTLVSLAMTEGGSPINWATTRLNGVDQDGAMPDVPYYSGNDLEQLLR